MIKRQTSLIFFCQKLYDVYFIGLRDTDAPFAKKNSSLFLNIDLYLRLVCGAQAEKMVCIWPSWPSISVLGKVGVVCWYLANEGVDSL